MLPLVRASGVARATERSDCSNHLLRARSASRRSTSDSQLRLSAAAVVLNRTRRQTIGNEHHMP
jgi:hypothetical protein